MCGIVGYIGSGDAEKNILDCLEVLEYRGYDSSGIAVKQNNKIEVTKGTYRISKLKEKVEYKKSSIGIGHTRWATHGDVSEKNAHPHLSQKGTWCIVHNGIIENYVELKNKMINEGVNFVSDTDSECIAQLLEYKNVTNIKEFIDVVSVLEGSYAICAINLENNYMYLAKNKSPLYIGCNNSEIFVSSDIISFSNKELNCFVLDDFEFCELSESVFNIFDKNYNRLDKNSIKNTIMVNERDLNNFDTFMEKEINDTPDVLKNILIKYSSKIFFKNFKKIKNEIKNVVIIGCGTAYHSGLIGATYIQKELNVSCEAVIASEFICNEPIINKNTLYIFISQSGETADTITALNMVKNKSLATVLITNTTHSTMTRMVDYVLPVLAGPEIAVASTKAYNAQLLVLYLFAKALVLTPINYNNIESQLNKIEISDLVKIDKYVKCVNDANSVFLLGKFKDYYTALEASLKIREITYINCTALPSGELKHGTLALISDTSICFVLLTSKKLINKTMNTISEIRSRGGKVVLVSQFAINNIEKVVDDFFQLPDIDEELIDIVSIIPFQILALKLSKYRGIDPDKPRNLAKSVTVE